MNNSRLDENNNLVETYAKKIDFNDVESYRIGQLRGGIYDCHHEVIDMTKEEFFGLCPTVWIVEGQFDYKEPDFYGLFHTVESAHNKMFEVIESCYGVVKTEAELEINTFEVEGVKLKSFDFHYGAGIVTAYQIRVKI